MEIDLNHLRNWIGKKETHHDVATAFPVAALTATLDRDDPPPKAGDVIPHSAHWLYFLETAPNAELGHDGHPKRGGFLPPVALPRRMWAGGRIDFRAPVRIGDAISRESEIISVEAKSGSSGQLVFVTVRHTVRAGGIVAIVEEHDIVYREAAKPGEATPAGKPAPQTAAWRRELQTNEAVLFRYSALIFNAHRIHYDIDYCRGTEGYPGLIVHGPLQTTLLLDLCRRSDPRPVRRLDYRATHPVFHQETFTVNGQPSPDGNSAELWTANAAGCYAMRGTATF
ncbi:MAG: MaoC family dehydratase N-terminal domain-containing protein [Burkholderiales bacterium]|nr:MaoC family dehydratase N-terminal domain-containing protein [Burkholderiales bacterium]